MKIGEREESKKERACNWHHEPSDDLTELARASSQSFSLVLFSPRTLLRILIMIKGFQKNNDIKHSAELSYSYRFKCKSTFSYRINFISSLQRKL